MSWIDVAILALVVLLGLIGVVKGVKKSALTLAGFIISFLLAFFLANVVAEALLGIDVIKEFVLGNGFDKGSHWSLAQWIYGGVGGKWDESSALYKNFAKPIFDIIESAKDVTIDKTQGFALYGAFLIFSAIVGVGIFFVVRFILIIVTFIIKTFMSKRNTVLTRLFGFLVGALRGALWAFAFTVVFSSMGGYTFATGIKNIGNEYENNAVVCGYFNDWAYGLRNKLFLPDKDAYGRLVEMVFTTQSTPPDPSAGGERLKLYLAASNLGYDNYPYTLVDNDHYEFDAGFAQARAAEEFASTEFDAVVKAILDYNKAMADKVFDQTQLNDVTSETFKRYTTMIEPSDTNINIDGITNELWTLLRKYEADYNSFDEDTELSLQNSTLKSDYDAIVLKLNELKEKYSELETCFGGFPDTELPSVKLFGTAAE